MKNIPVTALVLIFFLLPSSGQARTEKIVFTPEEVRANFVKSLYPYIIGLWAGPEDNPEDQNRSLISGRKFRIIAVKTQESSCQNIYLEEFNIEDGGSLNLVKSSKLGLSNCIESFTLKRWVSPTSYEFEMNKNQYVIEGLGEKDLAIYKP